MAIFNHLDVYRQPWSASPTQPPVTRSFSFKKLSKMSYFFTFFQKIFEISIQIFPRDRPRSTTVTSSSNLASKNRKNNEINFNFKLIFSRLLEQNGQKMSQHGWRSSKNFPLFVLRRNLVKKLAPIFRMQEVVWFLRHGGKFET